MHLTDLRQVSMSHIVHLKIVWDCEPWSQWSQMRIIQWLLLNLLLKVWNHTLMFLFKYCHELFVQGSLGRRSKLIQISMAPAQCPHFSPSFLAGDEAHSRINRDWQEGSAMCHSSVYTSLTSDLFQLDLLIKTPSAPAGNGWWLQLCRCDSGKLL